MGLQSALNTALTGLNAAETTIDVTGNNIANANTVGFKESTVNFATQFLKTQSIGSAPTSTQGGTNPRQIGLGVKVAEISPEFTQGTIDISSNPLDIAIEGDGFFITQSPQGEQLYTRNGQFKTNSENEIVTITGQRVLGYGVDDNFDIQPTGLTALKIPLGAAAVAQATENVFMEGALNPTSTLADTPGMIQSSILSNGAKEVPLDTVTTQSLGQPAVGATAALGGAGSVAAGTYNYKFTFLDGDGNEGPASNATSSLIVPAGGQAVDLNNIPQPAASSEFNDIRIYRSSTAQPDFQLVNTIAAGSTTYTDPAADASLGAILDNTGLDSGSYSYYVTFYNSASGAEESRPTAKFGPITADATTSPRIRLDSLPVPTTADYDGIRIYRNLANDQNAFHRVGEITPTQIAGFATDVSFIDRSPDASISANSLINLEGPQIDFGTPLVQVVSRNGASYENLFQEGTLQFTGKKGGRELAQRGLTIDSGTTVGELLGFMDDSMGVLKTAPEATFPTLSYGGTIADSRLQFTSNLGIENELGIDLSAFQMTTAGNPATSVPLDFTTAQEANGEGASADFEVFDSLGIPINVRVTTVLEKVDGNTSVFRWIADSADNQPTAGFGTNVGTGLISFDGKGNVISTTNNSIAIDREQIPSSSPLEFNLDFSQISGLNNADNQLDASRQDGFPAGTLSSFIVTENGTIQGVFSNGASRNLGQIRMARFANNSGLEQKGSNMFSASVNSGLPIQANPGSQGIGAIKAGAVELSNTDIGQNLIGLITASTQYRGGARVITTVQQLLDELLALRR